MATTAAVRNTSSNSTRGGQQQQQQPSTAQQQQQTSGSASKFKSPGVATGSSNVNPPSHHRESSNDRQDNKYDSSQTCQVKWWNTNCRRSTWVRKNSATTGTTTLVNRANTPQNSSRTNSPAPVQNAWSSNKQPDDRSGAHSHDQLIHLLFTLTVLLPSSYLFVLYSSQDSLEECWLTYPESIDCIAYSQRKFIHWHPNPFRYSTWTRISSLSRPALSSTRSNSRPKENICCSIQRNLINYRRTCI